MVYGGMGNVDGDNGEGGWGQQGMGMAAVEDGDTDNRE